MGIWQVLEIFRLVMYVGTVVCGILGMQDFAWLRDLLARYLAFTIFALVANAGLHFVLLLLTVGGSRLGGPVREIIFTLVAIVGQAATLGLLIAWSAAKRNGQADKILNGNGAKGNDSDS